MSAFVRVSDGDAEEIISVNDLKKIYKAEGYQGTAIIYEFRRYDNVISQWREEYPDTYSRDKAFNNLVKKLCGENNKAEYVGWRQKNLEAQREEEQKEKDREREESIKAELRGDTDGVEL